MDLLLPVALTPRKLMHFLAASSLSKTFSVVFGVGLLFGGSAFAAPAGLTSSQSCPVELTKATQLLLVSTNNMSTSQAHLRLFELDASSNVWRMLEQTKLAAVGRNGLAWSWVSQEFARANESIKSEGDGKTPAGLFRIGDAFGFGPSQIDGYIRLIPGQHLCVDDPASSYYNKIVSAYPRPPGLRGEEMGSISLYRKGFFIDYPTNAERRAGSCIFIHVWRSSMKGTNGCIAAAQSTVEQLHRWIRPKNAVIAILPQREVTRIEECLNLNDRKTIKSQHTK
jgi:L,D-peptidoglycan transpeptidase YkuD (ErfK/YbiS/YcfS/YnhG family)